MTMITKGFVDKWSSEYKYKPKLENEIIKHFTASPNFVNRSILYKILDWKAPRVKNKLDKDERFIREITTISFSTNNEKLQVKALVLMDGVGFRVATTILHFRFPAKYPIMDYRAWETLQKHKEIPKEYNIKDDFTHWERYFKQCRQIVCRENIQSNGKKTALKRLDEALWQFSKNNGKI